jgi:hypothetical protein
MRATHRDHNGRPACGQHRGTTGDDVTCRRCLRREGRVESLAVIHPPEEPVSPLCVSRIPRVDRVATLRSDFARLGDLLLEAEGSAAAALARERRIMSELLDRLEAASEEVPLVDQLAQRRVSRDSGSASRRRKSG